MTSRIRIKIGEIEVEYEGPESFLKEELPNLLTTVSKLYEDNGHTVASAPEGKPAPGMVAKPKAKFSGTTKTIAGRLGCKSGPDLAIAAAARLTLVKQEDSFSRAALHTEMKGATSYYKKSYGNNLTKNLDSLVKSGRLVEPATGKFALARIPHQAPICEAPFVA